MSFTITQRDKKLLVGLAMFVLIVVIGYWMIIPRVRQINDYNEKIKEENQLKDELTVKKDGLSRQNDYNEELVAEIDKLKGTFDRLKSSDIAAEYITGMMTEDYNLRISAMSVSQKKPAELKPYKYTEKTTQEIADASGVSVVTMDVNASGDIDKMYAFIDKIAKSEEEIRIAEYNIKGTSQERELSIEFEIYICED